MPPSPAVISFEDWKLKEPASPQEPTPRSRQRAPWAWAQSSSTASPCFPASDPIASRSATVMARWTGTIACVRSVIRAAADSTSMHQVSGSMSAKRGTQPANRAAEAVASKV